jgi:hypothetical protein
VNEIFFLRKKFHSRGKKFLREKNPLRKKEKKEINKFRQKRQKGQKFLFPLMGMGGMAGKLKKSFLRALGDLFWMGLNYVSLFFPKT